MTPMMAQWHSCKQSAPGSIVLFRLGDFYEAFYEDAVVLANELDLTLTKRQDVPMSGVPFHTCETYVDRLVAKGFRVAIAEQIEDPKVTKGIVKREVVRIVTPGSVINSSLLTDKRSNFLASVSIVNASFGLALLDLTTADFRTMEFNTQKDLLDELHRMAPKELFLSSKSQKLLPQEIKQELNVAIHLAEEWHFDHQMATEGLIKHFRVHTLDGFGLKGMSAAINAAGALLTYVRDDLNLSIAHITSLRAEQLSQYMAIDSSTQRHLELMQPLQGEGKKNSLLNLLDQTATPMGGRLLKEWLLHPLLSSEEIGQRQDAITALLSYPHLKELSSHLQEIRDLERLIMRIETGYASPRDLSGLRFSLEHIAPIAELLRGVNSSLVKQLSGQLSDVSCLVSLIASALVDAPPLRLSDGGIFKQGYSSELDELCSLKTDSTAWIARYQTALREETKIRTLKVGYTKVFGYYIEVSRGAADKTPDNFQRRQTLVNGERFITPELKEFEYKILTAEERMSALENSLFHNLRTNVGKEAASIRTTARALAQLDCLLSLAHVARSHHYIRPLVDDSEILQIEEGRHPIIEAFLAKETFIPNDTLLDNKDNRLFLITGPNMAGKSTYIRQVALIAIMAQMGSFVPAKSAHIGIIDKVFSRIGASDDLSRGQSTFMVEMSETANILHNATARSLIILDEIGRGTSTYDGISIAWSVAEYLLTVKEKSAKTLFATHYWELTALEKEIPGAINYNVAVHESDTGIVFLRKIVRGGTDKSYGIHVARLAGLPQRVIARAQEMLSKLEKNGERPSRPQPPKQLSLFPSDKNLVEELRKLDLNNLTPLEAIRKMAEWQNAF